MTRKGKARPARGGGGGLGLADLRAGVGGAGVGGAGAGRGGGGGAGAGWGAPRSRTKLHTSATKANLYDRPNTVVEFVVLPPDEELAQWLTSWHQE